MKLVLALALACVCTVALAGTSRAQQPIRHVVVVVLDDVGVDKIGAYGHPTAGPTPTLDALAAGGLRFDRAYVNPVCSPTRAAMLTGLYGTRTGIETGVSVYDPFRNPNGPYSAPPDAPWLPRLLNVTGTRSFLVGKWHLTTTAERDHLMAPIAFGFTRWRGRLANILEGQGEGLYSWHKISAAGSGASESTCTNYMTVEDALEGWLALDAAAGQRSLTWLALNAAHTPWNELPPAGLYTPSGFPSLAKLQQYSLEAADTLLGQLMDFYARRHPEDAARTLWLIVGDNGTPPAAVEQLPNHQHKGTVYEGGVHVPLILYGAGVAQPGRTTGNLVHAVDIHATLLDLFGAPRPVRTDGRSFAALLRNPDAPPAREAVFVRQAQPNGFGPKDWIDQAAINAHWSLIEREGSLVFPPHELFDLRTDPLQLLNLWPPDTEEELAAVAALQPVLDAGEATAP